MHLLSVAELWFGHGLLQSVYDYILIISVATAIVFNYMLYVRYRPDPLSVFNYMLYVRYRPVV